MAWLVKTGVLVNFISETVLIGFKCGVALHLASTQLPKLLGFPRCHGDFWERMGHVLSHLGETNPASLALGAAALGLLILGKRLLPEPAGVATPTCSWPASPPSPCSGWRTAGWRCSARYTRGLPVPGLPAIHPSNLNLLLPLAMACFLIGAVETAAIGRMFARKHGYRLESDPESCWRRPAPTSPPASATASRSAGACRSRS